MDIHDYLGSDYKSAELALDLADEGLLRGNMFELLLAVGTEIQSRSGGSEATLLFKHPVFAKPIGVANARYLERNGAIVIHLIRNPKAVYASGSRSISSTSNKPMEKGVYLSAWSYNRHFASARKSEQQFGSAIWLRYEDLVLEFDETLSMLERRLHLAVRGVGNSQLDSFESRISMRQKHLHNTLQHRPDPTRIEDWQSALNGRDKRILNHLCSANSDHYSDLNAKGSHSLSGLGYWIVMIFRVVLLKARGLLLASKRIK